MGLLNRIWDIFSGSTSRGASPFRPGRPFEYDPFGDYGTKPPKAPGLYRVLNEGNKNKYYEYIGETDDLLRRMYEHMQSGMIQPPEKSRYTVAREGSSPETRRRVEKEKIQRYKPPRNRRGGGGGRKPHS